jgi:hypothetical protein
MAHAARRALRALANAPHAAQLWRGASSPCLARSPPLFASHHRETTTSGDAPSGARRSRGFAAGASSSSSDDEPSLASIRDALLDESDPNYPLGSSPSTRVDEWKHPSGNFSFWLLRRSSAPARDANCEYNMRVPVGEGDNADVLACVLSQGDAVLGRGQYHPEIGAIGMTPCAAAALRVMRADAGCFFALPGLCSWVRANECWTDVDGLKPLFDEHFASLETEEARDKAGREAMEAAKAIALGVPRPGHSVLGRGTFAAAEPAWTAMAMEFLTEDEGVMAEHAAFVVALEQVHPTRELETIVKHMANPDPEYLKDAGGAMVVVTS